MKPKLVPNAGRVLRARVEHPVHCCGILSGCEIALPIIDQVVSVPRGVFAALSGFVTCAALISRLVAQKNLKSDIDADQ